MFADIADRETFRLVPYVTKLPTGLQESRSLPSYVEFLRDAAFLSVASNYPLAPPCAGST